MATPKKKSATPKKKAAPKKKPASKKKAKKAAPKRNVVGTKTWEVFCLTERKTIERRLSEADADSLKEEHEGAFPGHKATTLNKQRG